METSLDQLIPSPWNTFFESGVSIIIQSDESLLVLLPDEGAVRFASSFFGASLLFKTLRESYPKIRRIIPVLKSEYKFLLNGNSTFVSLEKDFS